MKCLATLAMLALVLCGCGGRSSHNGNDGGSSADDAADDSATQPPGDAPVQGDAASVTGPPSPGRIVCGNTTCDATTQVCCATRDDGGIASVTYACIDASGTCDGTTLTCDEPGDCTAAEVCCRLGQAGVSCAAAADCTGGGARQLCHVDADCPTDMPACCASQSVSGAGTCRTACDVATDGGLPDGGRPDGFVFPDGGRDGAGRDGGSIGTPSPGSIDCGNASCDPSTQFCCVTGNGGSATYACMSTGDTCGGNSVTCDEPDDCSGGQVCCRSGGSAAASCADAANCAGTTDRQRCHEDADCTTSGLTKCCPSASVTGGSCRSAC